MKDLNQFSCLLLHPLQNTQVGVFPEYFSGNLRRKILQVIESHGTWNQVQTLK